MADTIYTTAMRLIARARDDSASDPDGEGPAAGQQEIDASVALFILILLLIAAFLTSYVLKNRRIEAVHQTVISIFAGMVVGLVIRLLPDLSIRQTVSFNYQFFFNLLLPPIILASGFELHQANFFRNIGTILTFAFAGTFISAIALGAILYLWTKISMGIDDVSINFVDAIAVGATLSATDPVTILSIFNAYKVDPKLYTIIFGESILNDAIAIVMFETAQQYSSGAAAGELTILSLFESIGIFLIVFFASVAIGITIGIATSLLLKYTHIRRDPKTEACLVFLIAYSSYFLANATYTSGIVSLLFCGICLKHYAYHNMSRRTQLSIKSVFSLMSELSEQFIFIYLGLSIFTEAALDFKPLFILITVLGICVARWIAVFPLASLVNWFIRYRAKRRGQDAPEELPGNWKMMIYWAGLRGAVGVALAERLEGDARFALRATVLVVVILTVIIFGGTTARMLEILQIRTGVVEEIDSDDEFDIEPVPHSASFARKNGAAFGNTKNGGIGLNNLNTKQRRGSTGTSSYSTGSANSSPPTQPDFSRRSSRNKVDTLSTAERGLLTQDDNLVSDDENDLDLPPMARRTTSGWSGENDAQNTQQRGEPSSSSATMTARGALSAVLNATTEDAGTLFTKLDENFLKPHLLLDPENSTTK